MSDNHPPLLLRELVRVDPKTYASCSAVKNLDVNESRVVGSPFCAERGPALSYSCFYDGLWNSWIRFPSESCRILSN